MSTKHFQLLARSSNCLWMLEMKNDQKSFRYSNGGPTYVNQLESSFFISFVFKLNQVSVEKQQKAIWGIFKRIQKRERKQSKGIRET